MVEGKLLEALLTWHKDAFVAAANAISSGGPAMGVIAALSVVLLALVLWKLWRLARSRFWARAQAERAVTLWQSGARAEAAAIAGAGRGPRARVLAAAFAATGRLPDTEARLETARVAKRELAQARAGLRALELIALIAPLLGLLGTVLGMIEAFRQVQDSAGVADPAALAGGIWQALLTTAAGMAVAIPASVALTLFEALADGLRLDLEDLATRVFAAASTGAVERAPPRTAE